MREIGLLVLPTVLKRVRFSFIKLLIIHKYHSLIRFRDSVL